MAYLELFHGRTDPSEHMNDWGDPGPIFGPFPYFHTTYASEIKFGEDGHILPISGDLVYYDGMFYGDWSVFDNDILENVQSHTDLRARLAAFDDAKAERPQ